MGKKQLIDFKLLPNQVTHNWKAKDHFYGTSALRKHSFFLYEIDDCFLPI